MRANHRALRTACALMLLAAGPSIGFAQQTRPVTPADLADLNEAEDVQISPDGRTVAFVLDEVVSADPNRRTRSIWLVPADGSHEARRFTPADKIATSPRWSPDNRHIAFLSQGRIHLQPVAGGAARQLSDAQASSFWWSPDGSEIAFTSAVAGPRSERSTIVTVHGGPPAAGSGYTALHVLNVKDGSVRRVTDQNLSIREVVWTADGQRFLVMASGKALGGNAVALLDRQGTVVRKLAQNPGSFGTRRQILDISPDGKQVAFARMSPNGIGHWIAIVPAAGGEVRELLADHEGTIMKAEWSGDSKHLIAQSFQNLTSRILRVEAATGKVTQLAETYTSYPDFSVSADGKVIAFTGDTNDAPMEVWSFRIGDRQAKRLTRLNPQLAQLQLGNVSEFKWRSSKDGTDIYGVLITPPGYVEGRRYPTIVQIHGGPHFHWGLGWLGDWHDWAQLLASNGYVVMLPNPRGSTGRGWNFAGAIGRDLGGVDFQDIMDGTDALVELGIADADRLGVGGWSWGGYLTAWTVTQTNRFKAAVMGAGISNLYSHAGQPAAVGRADLDFRFGVSPYEDAQPYLARSPMSFVRNVKTPTMIVHGETDAKVATVQAWEFYTALKDLGVDTRLVIYPRTGHGIGGRAQRIDYLTRVLCWYDAHLLGRSAACAN